MKKEVIKKAVYDLINMIKKLQLLLGEVTLSDLEIEFEGTGLDTDDVIGLLFIACKKGLICQDDTQTKFVVFSGDGESDLMTRVEVVGRVIETDEADGMVTVEYRDGRVKVSSDVFEKFFDEI